MNNLELEWFDIICKFLRNDYKLISRNPNITMEIIKGNPDKPWDWYWMSNKPNITMEFIKENSDKPWDWDEISHHPFEKEKYEFIVKKLRLRFMGKLDYNESCLHEEIMKVVWHPKNIHRFDALKIWD